MNINRIGFISEDLSESPLFFHHKKYAHNKQRQANKRVIGMQQHE